MSDLESTADVPQVFFLSRILTVWENPGTVDVIPNLQFGNSSPDWCQAED